MKFIVQKHKHLNTIKKQVGDIRNNILLLNIRTAPKFNLQPRGTVPMFDLHTRGNIPSFLFWSTSGNLLQQQNLR